MTTFSVDLAGKTAKPYGAGMRVVAGEVKIKPLTEAIHAKDLDLKSIHTIQLNANNGTFSFAGTMLVAHAVVNEPGSYDNYASVSAYLQKAGDQAAKSGTFTLQFMALGE